MTREQLNQIRKDKKLSIAFMSDSLNVAEGTLKNFFYDRTSSTRVELAEPISKMLGVEVEDIIYSDVEELKETIEGMDNPDAVSVVALQKIHKFQLATMQEMHELEIINARSHYEQNIRELNDRIAAIKETHETHITNARTHYEQNIQELNSHNAQTIAHYERNLRENKENFEKILADKDSRISYLKGIIIFLIILVCVVCGAFIGLLILEVLHPDLGWIRF